MPVISNSDSLGEEYDCIYSVENNDTNRLTIECVCPKCGTAHRMPMFVGVASAATGLRTAPRNDD